MLNLLPTRRRLIPLLAAVSLLVVGTQTPVYTQFTAQIQQALQQLGIWPYDGSYVDGDVPVWSTAVTPARFVGSSSGGGGNLNAGTVTFSGGDVLDGTLTNRLVDRNGTNAKRWDVANTWTSTISNELFSVDWQTTANSVLVGVRTAATGTTRRVFFSAQATSGPDDYAGISISRGGAPIIRAGLYSASGSGISSASATELFRLGEFTSTATGGTITPVTIQPTYNQSSGTAANTDLLINRTPTAVGSGTQNLFDAQNNATSRYAIRNTGQVVAAAQTFTNNERVWDHTATLNDAADTFQGMSVRITNTASGANTRLFEVLGGAGAATDMFYVRADGTVVVPTSAVSAVNFVTTGAGGSFQLNGKIFAIGTAPTIGSGFGSSPSIPANNGSAAFTINVGTGGTASSGVITLGAATTGWNCSVTNRTAVAANRALQSSTAGVTFQSATTTTSATFTNLNLATGGAVAWAASDILSVQCAGY